MRDPLDDLLAADPLLRITDFLDRADPRCGICHGEGLVCEDHPQMAWEDGDQACCGGAGMPCVCTDLGVVP